jgi:hypothetical protein
MRRHAPLNLRATALLAAASVCGGCVVSSGRFALLSDRATGLQPEIVRRGVEGEDCVYGVLLLPISGRVQPSLQFALEDAMARAPGSQSMVDVEISERRFTTLLFDSICLRVRGNAARLR